LLSEPWFSSRSAARRTEGQGPANEASTQGWTLWSLAAFSLPHRGSLFCSAQTLPSKRFHRQPPHSWFLWWQRQNQILFLPFHRFKE
jgi:hypothetical protein